MDNTIRCKFKQGDTIQYCPTLPTKFSKRPVWKVETVRVKARVYILVRKVGNTIQRRMLLFSRQRCYTILNSNQ